MSAWNTISTHTNVLAIQCCIERAAMEKLRYIKNSMCHEQMEPFTKDKEE